MKHVWLLVALLCLWVLPVEAQTLVTQKGTISSSTNPNDLQANPGMIITICVNTNTTAGEVCADPNAQEDIECDNGTFTTRNSWIVYKKKSDGTPNPYYADFVDQVEWGMGHHWEVRITGYQCGSTDLHSEGVKLTVSDYKPVGFFRTNP